MQNTRNTRNTRNAQGQDGVLLGYEVGTGAPVQLPYHHLIATGLTRLSGKSTCVEGLINRSSFRSLVFRTKRSELGYIGANRHAPYFSEKTDWTMVQSLLEATMRERLKFERSWIIQASKNADTLAEIHGNIKQLLEEGGLRKIDESVYTNLDAYLELIMPQIQRANLTDSLKLTPGINVMDLVGLSDELQALCIRSTLDKIYQEEKDLILVLSECWKFIPKRRGSPVKRAIEKIIREGAVRNLYIWTDAQDLANVDTTILKQCDIWLLGKQRERNAVRHTLDQIPPGQSRPPSGEVMNLRIGHFFVCFGQFVYHVYALPRWLEPELGQEVARTGGFIPSRPQSDIRREQREMKSWGLTE